MRDLQATRRLRGEGKPPPELVQGVFQPEQQAGVQEEGGMYESLIKRLRGFWDGEGGPANEAADALEKAEANLAAAVQARDAAIKAASLAAEMYDLLALGPIAAAAKYGPDYTSPTDEDWLEMRKELDTAIRALAPSAGVKG